MEKVFIENEKLVQKVANRFAAAYNVDYEEAYAEACLAFVKYYPRWDAKKSKMSTYLWSCMWGSLQNWQRKQKVTLVEFNEETYGKEEKHFELEGLSDVAEVAVKMVVGELADLVDAPYDTALHVRNGIRRALLELGYTKHSIDFAFTQIEKALA